jgi:hypothetical protein
MIILKDIENLLNKIHHLFIIKVHTKQNIKRNFFSIFEKPIFSIILNDKRLKSFLYEEQDTFITAAQQCTVLFSQNNSTGKEIKGIQIGKQVVKLNFYFQTT